MWGIFKFKDKAEFHNESYPCSVWLPQDIEEESIRWKLILYSEIHNTKVPISEKFSQC